MKKTVNLADKTQAMELLTKLYGPKTSKFGFKATIANTPTQIPQREKRSDVAHGMGYEAPFNQGCHNPYSKRGEKT